MNKWYGYTKKFSLLNPDYHKNWMKEHRKRLRASRLMAQGRCPFCEMFLSEDYHKRFPCNAQLKALSGR